ncbi:hypothetical protein D3C78_1320010 [compost metagenome]
MIAARKPSVPPTPFSKDSAIRTSGMPDPTPTTKDAAIKARKAWTRTLTMRKTINKMAASNTSKREEPLCMKSPRRALFLKIVIWIKLF